METIIGVIGKPGGIGVDSVSTIAASIHTKITEVMEEQTYVVRDYGISDMMVPTVGNPPTGKEKRRMRRKEQRKSKKKHPHRRGRCGKNQYSC